MNVFATIVVVIGIVVIVGFLGYEIFGLVKDIRKFVKKKKEAKQVSDDNNK